MPDPRCSLVFPIYDEAPNIAELLDEVGEVFAALTAESTFEAIMVDDGSVDDSVELARAWKRAHDVRWLRILCLERNRGQSAAVLAGAEHARAPILLIMDGDRQNDPRDLLGMLELIESGRYQVVTGWRQQRHDTFVRRASSRIANAVRQAITGDAVRDGGCGTKALRRELFLRLPRFNGMHRFTATLAHYAGAAAIELPVQHRPRVAGVAKYGIRNRALRGLVDCFAVRWYRKRLIDYSVREEL